MPLRVRNFSKFQHYKHRSPPWIKLHRGALNDYHFTCLQDASKAHAMLLWLLASTCDNVIPDDAQWIARQIHATEPVDVDNLVSAGVLERYEEGKRKQRASKTLAPRKQNGGTEGEGEGEREKLLGTPSRNDREARPKGDEDTPKKVTWLTPIGDAWEAAYGLGSFPWKQAARDLAPLYQHHNADEIARRLAWYLENKGSEAVLSPDRLAAKHFTPSLKDFRLRFGAFDPSADAVPVRS